jgi:hypothetical protein
MQRATSWCVVFLSVAACGRREVSIADGCRQLRDREAALQLVRSAGGAAIDLAPHLDAMRAALGDRYLRACEASQTPDTLQCGLAAASADALTACLAPPAIAAGGAR